MLTMKQLNCDMFQISIEFDVKDFKKKEFVADVKPKSRQNDFLYHFGSKNKKRSEHAHFYIHFDGKDSFFRLSYHQGKANIEDVRPPYFEDVANWLGQFFKEKILIANFTIVFEYSKEYESLIPLNYPVVGVKSDLFKGTTVVGYDIKFPVDSPFDQISISKSDSGILRVFLFTKVRIDLSEFEIHKSIETVSKYTKALIVKRGDNNEGSNA